MSNLGANLKIQSFGMLNILNLHLLGIISDNPKI